MEELKQNLEEKLQHFKWFYQGIDTDEIDNEKIEKVVYFVNRFIIN